MEDTQIIELYFQRKEEVIKETDSKYGSYCFSVAKIFYIIRRIRRNA